MATKTKIEIIKETAEFYGGDPSRRGIAITAEGDEECVYFNPKTNNKCAFGRCADLNAPVRATDGGTTPLKNKTGPVLRLIDWPSEKPDEELDKILLPEYRGHSVYFWRDIQNFHDLDENFTPTGLSEIGQDHIAGLCETYKEIEVV
jgi:hypothetical protein